MDNILQLVILFIILIVVPIMLGELIRFHSTVNLIELFAYDLITGIIFMFGVFQFIAVPLILIRTSFNVLFSAWIAFISMMLILSIVKLVKKKDTSTFVKSKLFDIWKSYNKKEKTALIILTVAMCVLALFQMYYYIGYQHIDEDDSRFIVNALEAYENNHMFTINPCTGEYFDSWIEGLINDVVSPWSLFFATVARISMIHPTIIAHTVIPIFIIIYVYAVYWLLGSHLFDKKIIAASGFVVAVECINIFGHLSIYTSSTFLLTRVWQGKAVVAGLMLPVLTLCIFRIYDKPDNKNNYLYLFLTNMSLCFLSGMGIILGAIITGLFGIVYSVFRKNLKMLLVTGITCVPNVLYMLLNYVVLK